MPDPSENATLNNLVLEYDAISDGFEKSIIEHQFPQKDGSKLEDMGQNARTITMRCFFWDGPGHETYQGHYDLLTLLEEQDILELNHPQYGLLKVKIRSVNVRHDDRERTSEIDLSLIEDLRGEVQPVYREDVAGKTEIALSDCFGEAAEELAQDIRDALGPEASAILDQTLDAGQGIIDQFTDLTGAARAYVSKVDSIVSSMEATLNEIANPANSLIATINFATDLPGRVVQAIAETAERYVILFESIQDSPDRFIQSFESSMLELKDSLGITESTIDEETGNQVQQAQTAAEVNIAKQIDITGSMTAAATVGQIYSDDEAERDTVRSQEKTASFDAEGNYTKAEPTPEILTINDIEKSLATIREYLQSAIDQARDVPSLKTMARSLLLHANKIKLEREKIIGIEVENETPLHLVCLANGLPYNMADRILSLNPNFQNPSEVYGTVSIYAR